MQKSKLSGRFWLRKPMLVMKLMCLLLFLALHVSAANYGQKVLNIPAQETTIRSLFKQIERQSDYSFFYSSDQLQMNKKVYVSATNASLDALLAKVFEGGSVSWKVIDDYKVVISASDDIEANIIKPITGTVTDAAGQPLANVSVGIKGAQVGTVTDAAGRFSLDANTGDTLIFSIVGYVEKELVLGSGDNLNVTLEQTDSRLEEVVVIGFGTTKRRDLTGAIVSVKSEEITARPGPNPMESLQGRVAGLDITRTSGQPGAGVNMQLRGTRSFTASGTPLFIINGLPGDYATLNPYDIESIEVLKDASSTAVYGSAGSNGVVIITTKSGKAGRVTVDFNTYYGYNGWSVTPKMRSGDAYLQTKRDAYKYVWDAAANQWTTTGALWQSAADDETIFGTNRYETFKAGNFVDWADEFLRKNAATQNYSLSVAGGNERTKAYISFNYTDEKGQYVGDQYKLFSTSMRIDHKIKKWLSIGGNLQASYVDRDKAQDKLENALVTDPLVKPYKDDGTLNPDLGNNVYNLLLDYQPGVYANVDNNLKLFVNPYLELRPLKGLSFLSRLGTWLNHSNSYRFDGIGSVNYTYTNAGIAKAEIIQNRSLGYQWENILTYNFKIARDHDVTVTGVTTWNDSQNELTSMNQSNILSNNFKWYKFSGDVNTTALSSYNMSRTFGLIGRLNYSYLSKYLFTASVRRDGSSVLYEANQWDNFPALSAGWTISEEKFMEGARHWLDNLKFRVGWGITGSAKIDPYSSVANLESTNMSLGGLTVPIFRNSQFLTNPNLGWEKSNNTNIGLDASLFKNRIDLALEYYTTKTDGVIFSVTSPIIYGTYRPGTQYQTYLNICETFNRGVEVTLNTRNIVTNDFEWTSSVAFAYNREKIQKLTSGIANNIINGDYVLAIGEPVNSFRNYKLDGVWQIGEEKDAAVFNKRPGDLKVNVPGMNRLGEGVYAKTATDGTVTYYYNDLLEAQKYNADLTSANARYTYSNNDYQILGHSNPDWSLGFQNGFKYKNIDLTVYSYFRWGQMINYNMLGWYQPNGFATNASPSRTIPEYFNYWTPENPSNDFPVMNYLATSSTMTGFSGLSYVDGSFFKIKNITLGYTLPDNLLKKVAISRLRLYGTITNPVVVAKSHLLKQYDPEMNGELSYPLTKQMVVGLNVTF
ncbi:TonB-dependent receptor [Niabella insulamsoli]|uniref:SusC/RagA family TonB-linked outer membrane protein n=1 Tax=Niabella insulamsoli TaxID=3144874 RepID=UPI0031FD6FB1